MAGVETSTESILSLSFNQDNSCFAVGTTRGFRVYATSPLALRFRREWDAGIGIAELYKRSNMIALVGGGSIPRDSENKVVFWDDFSERHVAELEFQSRVCGLRFREERLFIALSNAIYVYTLTTLKNIETCTTAPNPSGLCCINQTVPLVAVFPGSAQGQLCFWREKDPSSEAPADRREVKAHDGNLACLAISADGTLAATASEKGTLIRVWDTETATKKHEFRRGTENAVIWSMAFSPDNSLLAVTSNHGTCHVFRLKGENKTSALSGLGGIFSSQWSPLKANITEKRSIVSFSPDSKSVMVIGEDGVFAAFNIIGEDASELKPDEAATTRSFMI